ncbi:MAG: ABC transporter ATP-binding protein [Flavobacteriaceae bacterium]|nr:ABC transporter ATP-binding protein [Flavobacteriaceae bacterium]MCY4216632.1 ABC transporter ATP-binding protein [Flavobacteriaceae bacterium]MCY4253696.1 ABC transporter ATP-binding protein [Flavobacteriaceae bacterium]
MNLEVEHLSKTLGKSKVLDKVSFTLKPGKVYALLGSNGSGKSTLLKILSGYYSHWTGTISYGTLDLKTHTKPFQFKTGYLSESNPLYNHMYVQEYLDFIGGFYHIKKSETLKTLTQFGLESYRYTKIQVLSKGYRQRVGLAACFIHNPSLLLLDEPTNGLDISQLKVFEKIISDFKTDRIILFTSHISQEVESLSEHQLVLNRGKIKFV